MSRDFPNCRQCTTSVPGPQAKFSLWPQSLTPSTTQYRTGFEIREVLEEIEDRIDVEEAKKALKERGGIPWTKLKKEFGL
ncbi:MAG: hypothetical protein WBB46_03365 [Candidatus Deferrimicrobiaceae bacterium]